MTTHPPNNSPTARADLRGFACLAVPAQHSHANCPVLSDSGHDCREESVAALSKTWKKEAFADEVVCVCLWFWGPKLSFTKTA